MQTFTNSYFKAGEARGEARGKMESILDVLKSRFQSSPSNLEPKLSKIADLELLAVLLERALYCESLKAFADSLDATPNIPSQ